MLSFSLDQAKRFLEALSSKLPGVKFTFQTFIDDKREKHNPDKKHLRKVLNGTLEEHAQTLQKLNEEGAGVFVTINITDGTGRKDKNITNLRSAFIDADNVDLLEVFKKDPDVDRCYPNILVKSKRGLHAYWLLDTWEDKSNFTPLQVSLIEKFGTDPEPRDLARVMRLPGFYHVKDPEDPTLVTLEHVETHCDVSGNERDGSLRDGDRRGYRISRLAELLNLELPDMTPKWQKQQQTRASISRPDADWAQDPAFRIHLAERYLQTIDPPVRGSGTAHDTVGSACRVGHDFDCGMGEFWPVLREWGARCSPPFEEKNLRYEFETFLRATKYPPGTKFHDTQFNRPAQYRGWLRERGIDVYTGGDYRNDDVQWSDEAPGVRSRFIEPDIPNLDEISEAPFPPDYSFEEDPLNRPLDADDERMIEDEQTKIKRALQQKKVEKKKRKKAREKISERGPGYLVWQDHGDPPKLGKTKDGRFKVRPQHPREIAWHFLNECCKTEDGLSTLFWHNDRFCQWDNVSYRRYKKDGYRRKPAQFLSRCAEELDKTDDNDEPIWAQFKVNQKRKSEALEALEDIVSLEEDIQAPCWLVHDPDLPDPQEIICCQNGLFDVRNNCLLPPNPAFFSLNSISIDYHPEAPPPLEFLNFLDSVFRQDEESKKLLKWWFGYCMTQDTRLQKMLMLVGKSRSGKGVLTRLLKKLVGDRAYCSMKFHRMSSNFALSSAMDKSVLVFPDARIGGKLDQAAVVAELLSITGEDPIDIDRKHLDQITLQLRCRIMVVSNEPLKLHDTSGALRNRLLLINFPYGRTEEEQDLDLEERLEPELPGILNWAIEGWHELQSAGRFFQPKSGIAQLETFAAQSSPMKQFIDNMCDLGPESTIATKGLFTAWKFWAEAMGYKPGNQATFGKNLLTAVPSLERRREGGRGQQKHLYKGLTVNAEKVEEFIRNNSDFKADTVLHEIYPPEQTPMFN